METKIILEIRSKDGNVLFSPMFFAEEVAELNEMEEEEVLDRLRNESYSPSRILDFLGSGRTWTQYVSYAKRTKPEMPDPDNFRIKLKTQEEFDLR